MSRYYRAAKWTFFILLAVNVSVLSYRRTVPVASTKEVIDAGDVFQKEKKEFEIRVDNLGVRPLAVKSVQPGCSCLQVRQIVDHGGFTTILMSLDPSYVRAGSTHVAAIIRTNDPANELIRVKVAFNVKTYLELSKSHIELLSPPGFKDSKDPFLWHGSVEVRSDTTLRDLKVVGCDSMLSGVLNKRGDSAAVLELEMKLTQFVPEFEKRIFLQSGDHKVPLDIVAIWR